MFASEEKRNLRGCECLLIFFERKKIFMNLKVKTGSSTICLVDLCLYVNQEINVPTLYQFSLGSGKKVFKIIKSDVHEKV